MGAHNHFTDAYTVIARGDALVADPGSGGTFNLKERDRGYAVIASGTRKLPNSVPLNVTFRVIATGNVTITSVAGVTIATLVSGQYADFTPLTSTTWSAGAGPATAIAIADTAGYTEATTVEQAIKDINYNIYRTGGFSYVGIPLTAFRVTSSGDVANTAGGGGNPSSNTTPLLEGSGSTNAQRLTWATGVTSAVSVGLTLPPIGNGSGVDGAVQAVVGLVVASAGTTNGWTNASGVITNWNGGADVTDAISDTADTAVHTIEIAVDAADVPASPQCVSVTIAPTTHGTDALYLYGAYVRFNMTEAAA